MTREYACALLALCVVFCGVTSGTNLPHRTLSKENGGKISSSRFETQNNSENIYKCFQRVRISYTSMSYYDSVVGCLNSLVAKNLVELNNGKDVKLKLFSGLVEFERNKMASGVTVNSVVGDGRTPKGLGEDPETVPRGSREDPETVPRESREDPETVSRGSRDDPETVLEKNVVDGLSNLTRNYAMKVRLLDGVKLRVSRGMTDALRIGIVFEAGEDDSDDDDDDDDNELDDEDYEEEEEEEEDTGRQARQGDGGIVPGGGQSVGNGVGGGVQSIGGGGIASGGNKKKKKKKKNSKKKDKEFKEKLPMLLIPFIIQAIILPLFLANLKLIAIKSIIVGKITLFLVAYNYLRRQALRRKEDNEIEHIAVNHYGYNGDMEYGALVNRRSL